MRPLLTYTNYFTLLKLNKNYFITNYQNQIIMIKKLTPPLLILMGLLFSVISAKADEVGFTSTISGTTVSAPTVSSIDGVTLAIARGSQGTGKNKGNMYWGVVGSDGKAAAVTFAGTCERTQIGEETVTGTSLRSNCWTGASMAIAEGKKFTITDFSVDIAGQDYKWLYKVEIVNGDGTVLYTSKEETKTPKATSKIKVSDSKLNLALTGKAYIKVYYSATNTTSNSKYFAVPELSITGTLETNKQTKYTKPAFTQGTYDRATASYAVTLATQNDEEGTINYTIGNNEQVTGAASGTVINVPYNTTVKATVSGTTFDTSDEAAFTTSDMPTLATPTQTIQAYDFEKQLYTVALSAAEGATIKYTVDGGAETDYTAPFAVALNKEVTAYAVLENMKNSATLTFSTAGAPKDGTHTTPQDYNYTDGMVYDAGAYSITNNPNYIGAKISSGNSSINGAIKMRIGRQADPKDFADKYGFHLDVNKGYIITSVKLQLLNNYNTDIALTGIYVDDATTNNLLATPLTIPYASGKDVKAVTAEAKNITASDRIVFTFDKNSGTDNPNQGQVLITVTYKVPEFITVNSTAGYGTMYYEKELKVPADTKAYTASLNGNTLTLNELTDGIIPAKTAVLVSGNGGLFEFSTTGATFTGKNYLKGTATDIATSSVEGGTVCTLGYIDGQTGFYKYTGETLNANKAYLVVPEAAMASAKGINIVIGNPTGVAEVKTAENVADAPIYNIAGQKVTKNAKGIVIINGKAYINK